MEPNSSMSPTPNSNLSKTLFITLVVVVVFVVAIYVKQSNDSQKIENNSIESVPTDNSTAGDDEPTPNTVVNWRSEPLKLPDLNLVLNYKDDINSYELPQEPVDYYDLGKNGDNQIIYAETESDGLDGPTLFFFEHSSAGYKLMKAMTLYGIYIPHVSGGYVLSLDLLAPDTTTYYKGVVGPKSLEYKGIHLVQDYLRPSDLFINVYVNPDWENHGVTVNKVASLSEGDMYIYQNQRDLFTSRRYILKLPSGLYTTYNVKYPFFTDNSVPQITWNDGSENTDPYRQGASIGGCGNPGSYIVPARDVADAVRQTGTTNTGEAIYEFKDNGDPIVTFFHELSSGEYNQTTGQYEKLSVEKWATHHAVIVYKNSIGDYVLFTNDKYGLAAECGKPVIYLYPTQTENISVKVGADVTKSEPEYGNGWNVLAKPNGELQTTDGKIYGSLFWEGLGHGEYPNITEGTIVPQSEIESTLRSQLSALGLNNNESNDFLEFWLSKMPNTPYIRLTWFTTEQMNQLAPLAVWPKPDTTIRVFLDFQGLQEVVSLPVQKLTSVPRDGFTLIEWGGILRK